jgi:hypothetical protein
MIDTADYHDVWTYDDSDEWMGHNSVPDMRLVYGVDKDRAETAAERLGRRFPTATFEVRDVHGTVVGTYGAAREERVRPVPASHKGRRRLGMRGA